ncbi:MAG: DUF4760 domain-containing protein [Aliivibrio sp.]|uniref:DUF4760 domain-containing protein n=1 Tax=Aliivibrio sp. TaxID=1872443 RepID=UPI001A3F8FC9|nr:DUF4760 domain-containing protein [Aliivibrio sp.]
MNLISFIGLVLSPLAILTSAFFAFKAAKKALKTQRSIARKRATLDVLLKAETDPVLEEATAIFRDVRDSSNFDKMLNPVSQRDKDDMLKLQAFLNHHELIFCGIMEDSLDELFLFQYRRGIVIHYWHAIKEFVMAARNKSHNARAYQRFQLFAEAWEQNRFITRQKLKPSDYLDNSTKPDQYQD